MNKKILTIGSVFVAATPLATLISCGAKEHMMGLGKHAYLYDESIQDSSSNIRVGMDKINRNQIPLVPVDVSSHFGAKMSVGGFGEERHFYSNDNAVHLGLDVFAPEGTKVVAPADSEVINAVWRHGKSTNNFAHGSGGNILIRTKVKDLPIDENLKELVYMKYYTRTRNSSGTHVYNGQKFREESLYFAMPKVRFVKRGKYVEPTQMKFDVSDNGYKEITVVDKDKYNAFVNAYVQTSSNKTTKEELIKSSEYIYISFMHMSKETIGLYGAVKTFNLPSETWMVSQKINMHRTPVKIKKGQTIGFVGSQDENGGWSTHTHVEIHMPSLLPHEFIGLKRVHEWFSKGKSPIFGVGTYSRSHNKKHAGEKSVKDFKTWSLERGIMNPNNIYKFYNDNTPIKEVTV